MSTDRNNQISGVTSVNSGPLIIRTYNNQSGNNTYLVTDYEYPVSSNYVLITSSGGRLAPSNTIYVSSVSASTMNMGTSICSTILAQNGILSSLIVSTLTVPGLSVTSFATLTGNTLIASSILTTNLITSTLIVNSSMISIGQSTNQHYTQMAYGNVSTSSNWITSLSALVSTKTVSMSANAQTQLVVSQVSSATSIQYTSTLGAQWSAISNATGLSLETNYSAGAISGNGQYGILAASGGYLYTTANGGASWTNTNPNTSYLQAYLPFNGSVTDTIGTTSPIITGSVTYVPGIVGSNAVNLVNTAGSNPTNYIRGSLSVSYATNLSVSGWINMQSFPPSGSYSVLWSFGSTSTTDANAPFQLHYFNNYASYTGFMLVVYNNSTLAQNYVGYYQNVALNTWYNFLAVYTPATSYLNINNVVAGTPSGAITISEVTGTYVIGGSTNTTPTYGFNGYIDDFKIYTIGYTVTPMVPHNWSNVAVSNSGQYMVATATNSGLFLSSTYGSTWSQISAAMLYAAWTSAQVSATGQYLVANSPQVMVQPQLAGLATSGTNLTTSPWQTGGITWIASASSTLSGFPVSAAFDTLGNTWWGCSAPNASYTSSGNSSAFYTTVIGVGSIQGDWIQIQSSVPLQMYSYQLGNGGGSQMVKSFYIVGSTDNTNWYPIQRGIIVAIPVSAYAITEPILVNSSATQTVGTSTITGTIYATTTNVYTYFRIICNTNFNPITDYVTISEWVINFQAGGQTYSTNYGATWNNSYALYTQQTLTNTIPIIQPQQSGLVANAWSKQGITWTASGSSNISGSNPYMLFNTVLNGSDFWSSTSVYEGVSNTYSGSTSTVVSAPLSLTISGEYFQINSSVPLILQSYSYACLNPNGIAKKYYIVGSNDNVTWYPIQYADVTINPFTAQAQNMTSTILIQYIGTQSMTAGQAGSVTTTSYSTTTLTYMYFRVICTQTVGQTAGVAAYQYSEFYMNFTKTPSTTTIISPSTTLSLSPSGQHALSTNVQNPILISELNFEGTYEDSIVGGLTNPTATTGSGTIGTSGSGKVGSNSLVITGNAGTNGSNTYVSYTLPSFFTALPNAFTISAWIYPTALPSPNTSVPIQLGVGTGGATLLDFYISQEGLVGFEFFTTLPSTPKVTILTSIPIVMNTWTHIAGIIANGMAYLYVNGILQNSTSYTGIPCTQTTAVGATSLIIGCVAGLYNQYAGYVDNLRIYNAALSPYQMQVIYENNVNSTTLTQLVPSFSVIPQQTGLASSTWNQGGIEWRASASSTYTGTLSEPYLLFNATINYTGSDCWASTFGYNTTTGAYTGTATTSVTDQGTISGEWFQLQTSVPLVLYSYFYNVLNNTSIAKTYYIVGSLDGQTWYPIQTGVFSGTIPFVNHTQTQTNVTYVNYNGVQTVIAGTSQPITTGTFPTTTTAYTYFRVIGQTLWPMNVGAFEYGEFVPMFTGPTNTSLYNVISPITSVSTGSSVASGTIPGVIVGSAISTTGQYMVIITNAITGNNVYYSTNYGVTFVGVSIGIEPMTSAAISYDGSYITVSTATTVYQLNNNSNGYSVAIGNQSGYQNQAQNAIAIGNYAGYQNQTANSIILNASGSPINSVAQGFYVAPIASYTASSSSTFSLLGYGIGTGSDNQIVQIAPIIISSAGNIGFTGNMPRIQLIDTTSNRQPSIEFIRAQTYFDNGPIYTNWRIVATGGQPDGTMPAVDGGNLGFYRNGGGYTGYNMVLTYNGLVGIGTTNPTSTLHVNGICQFSNVVSISLNNLYIGSGGIINQAINMGYQGITYYYTSDNSSYFRFWNSGTNAGSNRVYLDWPSSVSTTYLTYSPGGSGWVSSSDIRLKTNINPLSSCLTNILALQPVSYQWIVRPDPNQVCYGFIAQHTRQILPEIIEENDKLAPDGTSYLSINSNMNAFIVKAIQEQHSIITALEAQVLALKATVDALIASR